MQAVEDGKDSSTASDSESNAFLEADLQDFTVYRPHKGLQQYRKTTLIEAPRANEMVSLHEINEWNTDLLYFDGTICYGEKRRYLQRIPFKILSIGGYEEPDCESVGSDIWIQSYDGKKAGVWYRVRTPAPEYRRYHKPFLWMADLAKHVVDFLQIHQQAGIGDFRHRFYTWLSGLPYSDSRMYSWFKEYNDYDFRRVIVAHACFLYCQAVQVDNKYTEHPLWNEIHPTSLRAIPEQIESQSSPAMFALSLEAGNTLRRRKTTVTPYVFECFQHLPWAKFLYCQSPTTALFGSTKAPRNDTTATEAKPLQHKFHTTDGSNRGILSERQTVINVGDVVAVPSDDRSTWKTHDVEYYGYVQGVTATANGQALDLLWFYRPGDTACMRMLYPLSKELFLSDHCNCGDPPIYAKDVIRKPRIAMFSEPNCHRAEFFCRQQYIEGDAAWITLKQSHLTCNCNQIKECHSYRVGDTLLMDEHPFDPESLLEPVIVLENIPDGQDEKIKVRLLLRKGRDYKFADAEPNEVVFTSQYKVTLRSAIVRRCHVRYFMQQAKHSRQITSPYCRKGQVDHFFIAFQDFSDDRSALEPLSEPWLSSINEGWDPAMASSQPAMRGLDIFCGGGSLGRGLEDGMAVTFDWAVDHNNPAIHTYKANLEDKQNVKLFRGSVNQYLSEALEGRRKAFIARPGEVEVIAAGSPCQGFSLANPLKGNDRALFNESMVASVLSFIDFYRPKYALLENVKGMATGGVKNSVLAQVICVLVGMGYQVKTFALDAWSFGSPQSRSRIFISIAAPGLIPLPEPPHTHSHPENVIGGSLGTTANGLRTSARYVTPTPFKFISSAEATMDLPPTDSRTACIPFPDHRMSRNLSILNSIRVSCIPRFPGGATFLSACKVGFMPQPQLEAFTWDNKICAGRSSTAWQRVRRNKSMTTVMTQPRPDDGVNGTCLHWDEHRLLTIMEVRRAQGFPDREVILGLPAEQWRIIGNSVARPVALALGMSLRKAWLANDASEEGDGALSASVSKSVNGDVTAKAIANTEHVKDDSRSQRKLQQLKTMLGFAKTMPPALINTMRAYTATNINGPMTQSVYHVSEDHSSRTANLRARHGTRPSALSSLRKVSDISSRRIDPSSSLSLDADKCEPR